MLTFGYSRNDHIGILPMQKQQIKLNLNEMECQCSDLESNTCSVLNVLFYWYHSIAGAISTTKVESGKVELVINQFSPK